jgi:hypothetical protein
MNDWLKFKWFPFSDEAREFAMDFFPVFAGFGAGVGVGAVIGMLVVKFGTWLFS